MFRFLGSTDETANTGNPKSSKPSIIFCGCADPFESLREDDRDEDSSARPEKLSETDDLRVLDECYNDGDFDDDSTIVSNSGVSVLSIDYNGADNVVDDREKVDLSEIGDDDDESTVGCYDGEMDISVSLKEPARPDEETDTIDKQNSPFYATIVTKQSSSSAIPSESKMESNLSGPNQITQSAKIQGNRSAEAKRKELLKTLKNNIASHGRYSLQVASALQSLGQFHAACAQFDVSLTLYQESLDIYSSKLGDHDSHVTDLQMHLGAVNEKLGNDNVALEWFAQALFMIIDISGNYNLTACKIRVSIAKIINLKGLHKEAVKELKKALKGYREHHGDEHKTVAETVDLIADFYSSSGNHLKANNVRGELVKLRVALHGSKSAEVAEALMKWASCHGAAGDLTGALRVMKQSYVMFYDVEGANGIGAEETLEKIGFLYSKMNRAEKAIKAHTSVALTRKNKYGEHSVELAASYLSLGKAYMDDGKLEKALKAFNRAMSCYGKSNESNNGYISELMETLHTIGVLHLKTFDYKKALKTFENEKSVRQRYMQYDQLGLALAVKGVGEAEYHLTQFAKSFESLIQALQLCDQVDGRKTLFAEIMYICGQTLEGLNDESRAFTCYKEAVQIFTANGYDDGHPPMKIVTLKLLIMGLHDITSLLPSLRCQLIDGESHKFEF
jgi:tetratricopeptide (TPR) repeat protein